MVAIPVHMVSLSNWNTENKLNVEEGTVTVSRRKSKHVMGQNVGDR